MTSKTKTKAPKPDGTVGRPWPIDEPWAEVRDLGSEGYYTIFHIEGDYVIERKKDGSPKKVAWEIHESEPTEKKAIAALRRLEKSAMEFQRDNQERDYFAEVGNNGAMKTRAIVQLTITKKTTKQEISEHIAGVEQTLAELKEKKAPPPFKFDKERAERDRTHYRIRQVMLFVANEIVEVK